MKKEELYRELQRLINSGFPVIYFYTYEEREVIFLLKKFAKESEIKVFFIFNLADGLKPIEGDVESLEFLPRKSITAALQFLSNFADTPAFVVFQDAHLYLFDNSEALRAFKNIVSAINSDNSHLKLFISSPLLKIPLEIAKDVVVVDFPLPDRDEIEEIINYFSKRYNLVMPSFLKKRLVESLNGLTRDEIKNIIGYCLADDGRINEDDLKHVMAFKKQIIKKGGLLELIEVEETVDDIGGLKNLKKWLENKQTIFSNLEIAKKSGVDIPKGILLVGKPGCGKSLTAKVCASIFKVPLLRLDIGAVMGPYLGQSEENIRKVIKLAEAISPCILWIDEIEKGFSGVGTSGTSSSEVITRIFGTLLTWMQEKTSPVFVVATSNDISLFPPEFLRKGRFDEIFFVDFPKASTLEEIVKIHFKKRGWDEIAKKLRIKDLCLEMEKRKFSGADAEALVKETIEQIFLKKVKSFKDNLEDSEENFIKSTTPKEVEEKLREIFKKIKPIGEFLEVKKDMIKEINKEMAKLEGLQEKLIEYNFVNADEGD